MRMLTDEGVEKFADFVFPVFNKIREIKNLKKFFTQLNIPVDLFKKKI